MTQSKAAGRRPLTLEDLLLLLMRRLLIPVALAEALFLGMVGIGVIVTGSRIYEHEYLLLLAPAMIVAIGLVVVGIPAGYGVSMLGWSLRKSMAILASIAFILLEFPQLLFWGYPTGVMGVFAAMTAAIWTWVNKDMFGARRRPRDDHA